MVRICLFNNSCSFRTISKPNFNPNDFVEGIDASTWKDLNESPEKPLYNRPLKGTYAPGSTYKPFMALAALETGKRTPSQSIADPGYFILGNNTFRDDKVCFSVTKLS